VATRQRLRPLLWARVSIAGSAVQAAPRCGKGLGPDVGYQRYGETPDRTEPGAGAPDDRLPPGLRGRAPRNACVTPHDTAAAPQTDGTATRPPRDRPRPVEIAASGHHGRLGAAPMKKFTTVSGGEFSNDRPPALPKTALRVSRAKAGKDLCPRHTARHWPVIPATQAQPRTPNRPPHPRLPASEVSWTSATTSRHRRARQLPRRTHHRLPVQRCSAVRLPKISLRSRASNRRRRPHL